MKKILLRYNFGGETFGQNLSSGKLNFSVSAVIVFKLIGSSLILVLQGIIDPV